MSRGIRAMVPRLHRATTALLICDVQVKFESLIYRSSSVIDNIALLNGVANILGMPVVATEQYPKVFGPTSKVRYLLEQSYAGITDDVSMLIEGWCNEPIRMAQRGMVKCTRHLHLN
jgi:ABC-type microcin C transport system permease subunit YejB